MSTIVSSPDPGYPVEIDLRNRSVAAFWAWLWPGAGHIYQRRYAKGFLFMVCILGIYFYGFGLGGWRVVYASFRRGERRLPYLCQIGVGLPALPALVEWKRAFSDPPRGPLFGGVYRPPGDLHNRFDEQVENDLLAQWHNTLKFRFDLGTLYTMIAGLLNMLAIYDAYAGPAFTAMEKEKNKAPPKKDDTASGK